MRVPSSALVIVVGLLLLYAAATGKLACFGQLWRCVTGQEDAASGGGGGGFKLPSLPKLPDIGGIFRR